MPFFSKVYSLKSVFAGTLKNSIGVVTVTVEENQVTLTCSVNKLTSLSVGEYLLKVFDSDGKLLLTKPQGKFFINATLKFDCEEDFSGVSVVLCDSKTGSVVATTNVLYAIATEIYDDEKIADEDYYLQEGFYERKTYGDGYVVAKENTTERKEEEKGKISSAEDGNVDFSGREVPFYVKVCGKVLGHRLAPKLSTCVPNSTFYLMNEDKEWYLGTVKNDGKVEYVCYAVRANALKYPAILEYADFLPSSLFSSSEGYYVTYRDAITGKVLKKQNNH